MSTIAPAIPTLTTGENAGPSGASGDSVIVIGAGLAGMAAAVRLAQAGRRVTLIEATRRLGGRATTYERAGDSFDNCQHVLLGCCTNAIDLFERLGVAHLIAWHDTLYFLDEHGRRDVLRRSRLPAPFHLTGSLLKFRALRWRDKCAIARALAAAMAAPAKSRRAWHDVPFSAWLARHKQPASAIHAFWETVVVSALNDTPDRVSTAAALQVFLQGFMAHRDGYRVGVPRVPLARLYASAAQIIEVAGGQVILGRAAARLRSARGTVTGIELKDGDVVTAGSYVCAVPPHRLTHVVDDALRAMDRRLAALGDFSHSPTISIRLRFDRRVMDLPHAALLGSPVQWVFAEDVNADGEQTLRLVASAAREWVDDAPEEIGRRSRELLCAYLPAARAAQLISVDVVKARRATFCPSPGSEHRRPPAAGAIGNLFLGGDWCRTGWPATMEGAVRSGYLAASAILGRDCIIPDLQASKRFSVPAFLEAQVAACR